MGNFKLSGGLTNFYAFKQILLPSPLEKTIESFMTMMKSRGENGSTCQRPRVAWKKEGPPLTRTAKLVEVKHVLIQFLHLELKPCLKIK